MKELFYLLFRKKSCPHCGGRMEKEKSFETRNGRDFNSTSDPFFVPNASVKHYLYSFRCLECGRSYPLKDLSEHRKE